jgi:ADP-glucose pyrophosphorylase
MANLSSAHGYIEFEYEMFLEDDTSLKTFLKLLSMTTDFTDYHTSIDLEDSLNLLQEAIKEEEDLTIEFSGIGRWAYFINIEKLFKLLRWVSEEYGYETEFKNMADYFIKINEPVVFKFVDIEESCELYYGAIMYAQPFYNEDNELTTKTMKLGDKEWKIDTNKGFYFKLPK